MKDFEALTTDEMAHLSEEQVEEYKSQGWGEAEIRMEIANCKKILAQITQ